MATTDRVDTLTADEALRLGDFARACKAAARIVALYPETHPAIQTSLRRVSETADRLRGQAVSNITVLPDGLTCEGRAPAKADSSLTELATLLHGHLIGELRITGAPNGNDWHAFLSLLAKPYDEIQANGGFERAWTEANGASGIEVRQIDYAEVLREREGGFNSTWDHIISNYLRGELSDLGDEALAALYEIVDGGRFKEFTAELLARAQESAHSGRQDVVLQLLQAIADFAARQHPEQLDRILREITGVLPQLPPDQVITLITTGVTRHDDRPGIDLSSEVRARLTNETVAEFVAASVSRDEGATARLAHAFQALVPDESQRQHLLEMAEREAADLPIGQRPDFPDLWKRAAEMLTTYSDSRFVSEDYGRELATARAQAIEVEKVSDDPPDRIRAWLETITADAIRRLDHQVVMDLVAIEKRHDAWAHVLESALKTIEQHVLTGDLPLAQELLDVVVAAAGDGGELGSAAAHALDRLRSGSLMRHVVLYIGQAQDSDMQLVSRFCRTLGPSVIGTLVEALASEHGIAVKRLREVLLSFGAAGRAYADELRSSANPAVRRTAVELLRAFGGEDALPGLAALLEDAEPAVQREALRAMVQIGTAEAYARLQEALKSGNQRTRDAMMQALMAARDERAAPLFVYILEHSDPRALESVCITAMEALGKLSGDDASVEALSKVLYRGSWFAPIRTARLRTAAAMALRNAGSPAATTALEQAANDGPRSVRRIARAALNAPVTRAAHRRPS